MSKRRSASGSSKSNTDAKRSKSTPGALSDRKLNAMIDISRSECQSRGLDTSPLQGVMDDTLLHAARESLDHFDYKDVFGRDEEVARLYFVVLAKPCVTFSGLQVAPLPMSRGSFEVLFAEMEGELVAASRENRSDALPPIDTLLLHNIQTQLRRAGRPTTQHVFTYLKQRMMTFLPVPLIVTWLDTLDIRVRPAAKKKYVHYLFHATSDSGGLPETPDAIESTRFLVRYLHENAYLPMGHGASATAEDTGTSGLTAVEFVLNDQVHSMAGAAPPVHGAERQKTMLHQLCTAKGQPLPEEEHDAVLLALQASLLMVLFTDHWKWWERVAPTFANVDSQSQFFKTLALLVGVEDPHVAQFKCSQRVVELWLELEVFTLINFLMLDIRAP